MTRITDDFCCSSISSITPSVMQMAKRYSLSVMLVLSIVLIVRLSFSSAKVNNNYYNSLDLNGLNWSKKNKKVMRISKSDILMTKKFMFIV